MDELEGFYPTPTDWPDGINVLTDRFKKLFPKLQIAIAEFKPSLPLSQQIAFEEAWLTYQDYDQYAPFGSNPNFKENFKYNVDNLLKFAKPT
ncbi:MAG: hypothetical protein JJE30_04100 [Desulfuromonadales bacterium]|nr:hypothetical protein [Desulfuromonadales bacterium]